MDVDAIMQLFDLKTTYQFVTTPGFDRYNMPLYSIQTEPGSQQISYYPVYQGFEGPCYINGIPGSFHTQITTFQAYWSNYVQTLVQAGTGNGSSGPYTLPLPFTQAFNNAINFPYTSGIIRGHVDMSGIIATGVNDDPPIVSSAGNFIADIPVTSVFPSVYFTTTSATGENITLCDSGQFLDTNINCGLLMNPGSAPLGNTPITSPGGTIYTATQNTVNYITGTANNIYFSQAVPAGMPIQANCIFFELGIPRSVLFYDNTLTIRPPPNTQYIIQLDAYLSPAAFLSTGAAIQFAYMSEFIARGTARKILSDTGDWEQFAQYESLYIEQRDLVWKRSQRQFTATRTQTIYSQGPSGGIANAGNNFGIGLS